MEQVKIIPILIAEKEEDTRTLLKETLSSVSPNYKFSVIEASDAAKAEFKAANQKFSLVIAATNLKGKDCLQMLKAFESLGDSHRPDAVMLLVDGEIDDEWSKVFTPLYCIKKPCDTNALAEVISSALALKSITPLLPAK